MGGLGVAMVPPLPIVWGRVTCRMEGFPSPGGCGAGVPPPHPGTDSKWGPKVTDWESPPESREAWKKDMDILKYNIKVPLLSMCVFCFALNTPGINIGGLCKKLRKIAEIVIINCGKFISGSRRQH